MGFVWISWIFLTDGASYCICKDGLSDAVLQKNIDYACGAGADCSAISQGGSCFNPNTVKDHCNYAVNSYYQKKGQATGTCDFSGTAIPSASPPGDFWKSCFCFCYVNLHLFRDFDCMSDFIVNFVLQLLLLLDVFFHQVAGMWIFICTFLSYQDLVFQFESMC